MKGKYSFAGGLYLVWRMVTLSKKIRVRLKGKVFLSHGLPVGEGKVFF